MQPFYFFVRLSKGLIMMTVNISIMMNGFKFQYSVTSPRHISMLKHSSLSLACITSTMKLGLQSAVRLSVTQRH
jgi:hypothetical protein